MTKVDDRSSPTSRSDTMTYGHAGVGHVHCRKGDNSSQVNSDILSTVAPYNP